MIIPMPISALDISSFDEIKDIDVLHPVSGYDNYYAWKTRTFFVDVDSKNKMFECPVCGGVHYFNLGYYQGRKHACVTCGDTRLGVELLEGGKT